jgi:hypothetical protein
MHVLSPGWHDIEHTAEYHDLWITVKQFIDGGETMDELVGEPPRLGSL